LAEYHDALRPADILKLERKRAPGPPPPLPKAANS
jgi:hypothetical protein